MSLKPFENLRNGIARIFGGKDKAPAGELQAVLQGLNQSRLSRPVLEKAVALKEEITPHLLRILKDTISNAKARAEDGESFAHMHAMYLLAQFRTPEAYPLLLEFIRLPDELMATLTGEAFAEDFPRMLASVCGNDLAPVKALIESPDATEYARSAALDVFNILLFDKRLNRNEVVAYYQHLLRGGLERKGSLVWSNLAGRARDIHPAEVLEDLRKAFAEELIETAFVELDYIEATAKEPRDAVLEESKADNKGLITDTLAELESQDAIGSGDLFAGSDGDTDGEEDSDEAVESMGGITQTYIRETPKTGRNDPCPCGSGKKFKKCCGKDA